MNQMNENLGEETAVAAFRVKLGMSKIDAWKKTKSEASKHQDALVGELFDISCLPLPVKKHIITAGIIQGEIFQYGDGFANIKEVKSTQQDSVSSKLCLEVQALSHKSYTLTIEVIESLMNEILEPQKKTFKRLAVKRSWNRVLKNEFEIKDLEKPVISHLITKGIIKGEIYHSSGAVVNAKGSPYMGVNETLTERPIYLLVQGPDEKALYWGVDRIQKLIKEAEEIMNNDIPQLYSEDSAQDRNEPAAQTDKLPLIPKDLNSSSELKSIEQHSHPVVDLEKYFPLFMRDLGKSVDADVNRCVVLVQWLLAHPLLVSFFAYPPKGLESKNVSRKMVITALLNLPLYDQYKCTHTTSKKMCTDCHKFFFNAQDGVRQCFEAVVGSGYDISKLRSVDDYINDLSGDSDQVGVLYDYPLPLNLFYMDSCRLFIDLIINCGLEIEEHHIVSYLRSTKEWYPIEAFKKIIVYSPDDTYNPSKNPKTHKYPIYFSLDHHGAMINFLLETIGKAAPGQLFPADAERIPKCNYFPFINRLSVFSKLYIINKKYRSQAENETCVAPNSISLAAYNLAKESLETCDPYTSCESLGGSSSQTPHLSSSSTATTSQHGLNNPFENTQLLQGQMTPGHLPSSFSTIRDPTKPVKTKPSVVSSSKTLNPSRIYRKEIRKMKVEEIKQMKKLEVEKTMEMLKEKHGENNFWTMNKKLEGENSQEELTSLSVTHKNSNNPHIASVHPQMTSTFSHKLQQSLGTMQLAMPATQSVLFGASSMLKGQENKYNLEHGQSTDDSHKSSQQNSFSEVINELQGYIHATDAAPLEPVNKDKCAVPQQSSGISSTQLNMFSTEEQYSVGSAPPQESAFDSIIQQLQQYIDSNNQTSSLNNAEDKKTSEDGIRKPSESNSSGSDAVCIGHTREHSQLKRKSAEHQLEPQPKRVDSDPESNFIQEEPMAAQQIDAIVNQRLDQNPNYGESSVKQMQREASSVLLLHPRAKSQGLSMVSIVGDSLLRRARSVWGGLDDKDIRKDSFDVSTIYTEVMSFHNRGGHLNPICVLMFGVNEHSSGQKKRRKFSQNLKDLLNYLYVKGYFVFLVTPPIICNSDQINRRMEEIVGIMCSFHSKPNIVLVPFHKMYRQRRAYKNSAFLESNLDDRLFSEVLSDFACDLLGDQISSICTILFS